MKSLSRFLILFFFIIANQKLSSQEELFQKISAMKDSVSEQNIIKHIKALEYAGGHFSRVNFTAGNDSAAVYIKSVFDSIPGLTSVEVDTFFIPKADTPYNTKPLFNIVATIEGKVFPNTSYIIGAHYDCSASRMGSTTWKNQWETIKAPGADDNATGVAALFEIARIMTDTTFDYSNDYTIKLIAFGAEEAGPKYESSHHGSMHYAENAKSKNNSIIAMVSVDMIGYNNNFDYTAIVSNSFSQPLAQKYYDTNEQFSIGLITNSPPFIQASYSDHDSFWKKGYKAILLIENAPPWNSNAFYNENPFYHRSSDTFETVNTGLVKKVTQLTLASAASTIARLTDIKDEQEKPENFILAQNYPNPFNPVTIITYKIPEAGFVSLKIFNSLGKEVSVIENQFKQAGNYNIQFNAGDLPSGIYFYSLTTGNFTQSRKMMLLK